MFVLRQWIAEDTKPKHTDAEARDLADQALQQTRKYVKHYPQYYQDWNEKAYYNPFSGKKKGL